MLVLSSKYVSYVVLFVILLNSAHCFKRMCSCVSIVLLHHLHVWSVYLFSHDRIKEVPDFPDIDIRDEQTLSNTQQEDWLLPTEPLHGARPRQTGRERPPVTGRERPPVIDNRPPMDATGEGGGGAASRKPGRTPLLSPGW